MAGTGSAPASGAVLRGARALLRYLKPLAQQQRQVVLDEALQLGGIGKALVGHAAVSLDPGQHLRQARLTFRRGRLYVDQPRHPAESRYSSSRPDTSAPGATQP